MNNQGKDIIITTIMVVASISLLWCSILFLTIDVTTTLLLLTGVWTLDVILKKMLLLENETLFADFSFASFVFSLGRGVSLIEESLLQDINSNNIITFIVIIFMLLLLWLGNLNISAYLIRINSQNISEKGPVYWISWAMSFIFAMVSATLVFVL